MTNLPTIRNQRRLDKRWGVRLVRRLSVRISSVLGRLPKGNGSRTNVCGVVRTTSLRSVRGG